MPERKRPPWQMNYWQLLAFVVWGFTTSWALYAMAGSYALPVLALAGLAYFMFSFAAFALISRWLSIREFGRIPPMPPEWKRFKLGEPLAHEIEEEVETERGKWALSVGGSWAGKIVHISVKFVSYESRYLDWETSRGG